jgi:hypothetical protein
MEFKDAIAGAIKDGLKRNLADKFEVSEDTVERWANGVANPHPVVKDKILDYLWDFYGFNQSS